LLLQVLTDACLKLEIGFKEDRNRQLGEQLLSQGAALEQYASKVFKLVLSI